MNVRASQFILIMVATLIQLVYFQAAASAYKCQSVFSTHDVAPHFTLDNDSKAQYKQLNENVHKLESEIAQVAYAHFHELMPKTESLSSKFNNPLYFDVGYSIFSNYKYTPSIKKQIVEAFDVLKEDYNVKNIKIYDLNSNVETLVKDQIIVLDGPKRTRQPGLRLIETPTDLKLQVYYDTRPFLKKGRIKKILQPLARILGVNGRAPQPLVEMHFRPTDVVTRFGENLKSVDAALSGFSFDPIDFASSSHRDPQKEAQVRLRTRFLAALWVSFQ